MASPNTSTSFAQTLGSLSQAAAGQHDLRVGSIAQTMPSFAVNYMTGLTLYETLSSTANVVGEPSEAWLEEVTGSVITSDARSTSITDLLTSVATVTDTPTFDVTIYVTDIATVSESFPATAQTTLLSSGVKATESVVQSVSLDLVSIVNASSLPTSFILSELSDTAIVSDNIDPGATYYQLVSSTVNASDVLSTGQNETIVSNATATEAIEYTVSATEFLASIVDVTDTLVAWASAYEMLSSTAQASESFNFEGSVYNNSLTGTATVTDNLWAKDFGAIAWVMNTQSGGLTSYSNFGFTSLAFHAGKLYATSPEGLFEFGADDDEGRKIESVVKSGFLDFGLEEKKRLSDIYIGYTGGDLEFDVETYDGPEEVYTYEMEHRDADAPRNSRVKPGRGLSSRYWRFTQRNVNGADFQTHDIAVEVAKSKRRV